MVIAVVLCLDMGGKPVGGDWGVGGSQELETLEVSLQGKIIEIESETTLAFRSSAKKHKLPKLH